MASARGGRTGAPARWRHGPRYDILRSVTFRFAKYEGLGNDFVVVTAQNVTADRLGPGAARAICDRHLGVGADGVLVTGLEGGRPFMRILNADGSEPEMCGNGLRCVALHLVQTGMVPERAFVVDTASGPHGCEVLDAGEVAHVEVEMRAPSLAPADVPVDATGPLVDAPLELDGRVVRVTAVSMGNPHAVTFDALDDAARAALGPRLERDPRFPQRV